MYVASFHGGPQNHDPFLTHSSTVRTNVSPLQGRCRPESERVNDLHSRILRAPILFSTGTMEYHELMYIYIIIHIYI